MGNQAIAVPANWEVKGTLECDTNQLLFLHTGKYLGHYNGKPSNSCSCKLESIRDTRMGQKAIVVGAHWKTLGWDKKTIAVPAHLKVLGTLEWDTKQ